MRLSPIILAVLIGFTGCASSAMPPCSETPKGTVPATAVPGVSLSQVDLPAEGISRLLILYDNASTDPRLKADWGFSILVDYDGHRILFDTGAYGPLLLENARRLGIDPWSIEAIVLSHEHYDHTGGIKALLDTGIHPRIYVPSAFSKAYENSLGSRVELLEVDDRATVFPGLSVVCVRGAMAEEALVAETDEGSLVITGCAHPGVSAMIRSAQSLAPGKVSLLVGGFHLLQSSDEASLKAVAEELASLGVERVLPTHCTSAKAIGVFEEVFGDRALDGGVGRLIECPSSSAASR